ncbi:MAG: hypothetical protein H8E66_28575 [Planctomycetes bacterium]|nr:hypothetical protein [Planctomycetota bacterium]
MRSLLAAVFLLVLTSPGFAKTKTWDGKYETGNLKVTIVYFVPSDRTPLPDWRERVDYYCRRIELFHEREFQGQTKLTTVVHSEPLVSEASTAQLRRGDQNAIFFRTLSESDRRLDFGKGDRKAFPILLALSEINWRPLDDFYRLHPENGKLAFEGHINKEGHHFPFATSGGARATYIADRGVGWGLVSADGWRVPYRGSDCVIYHEGCGHTVGLPHPEPGNGSVMSGAQYLGWISESWIDKEQKSRLGWIPQDVTPNEQIELFSRFRAIPDPATPKPHQEIRLALNWPENAKVKLLRIRLQTAIGSPWIEVPQSWTGNAPAFATLGEFDRAIPISYRVDAELESGVTAELWGYLQVRSNPRMNPQPLALSSDLALASESGNSAKVIAELPTNEVDLLALVDVDTGWMQGEWSKDANKLLSPKRPGARIELPYTPPEEYRLKLVVEPLDLPHGLLLGQRSADNRFAALLNFSRDERGQSALENIDGRNVGNDSTFLGKVFQQNRLSQVIVTVREQQVMVAVDGNLIIDWSGDSSRLSLSDYWKTPNDTALFLGAYDCRYRFHRVTLEPISGEGNMLKKSE